MDSQVILASFSKLGVRDNSVWFDSLLIPSYSAILSLFVLLAQFVYAVVWPINKNGEGRVTLEEPDLTISSRALKLRRHISETGGSLIFGFKLVRLLGCLALVCISTLSTGVLRFNGQSLWGSSQANLTHEALWVTYVYLSALAFAIVLVRSRWGNLITLHLETLLFVAWAVFLYRDVWPLATYTLSPQDLNDGWIIWAEISLLTVAAILIPGLTPRQYVPVDFEDVKEPSQEQTASWFSMLLFTYCDATIFKAHRMPHLKLEELPKLSDTDYTTNLVKRSYPRVDPLTSGRKHIFWKLVFGVFLSDHIKMTLLLLARVCTTFVAPIGVNRLLNYLETGGDGAVVRPWFWISWLFCGPMLVSLLMNRYYYYATRVFVQSQGILTQLIFDHALRIRVKSETEDQVPAEGDKSALVTPPSGASSSTSEPPSSTASAKGKSPAKSTTPSESKAEKKLDPKGKNLTGKINNLVTSDLNMLQVGQLFLLLIFSSPPQLILSIVVLYQLLGWSIFPGVAAMVLMSPLPVYLAKLMRGAQVQRMKKSDSRVQSVTESMNVIRMIKFFGWERKMSAHIAEKREEEMVYLRNFRMLELLNTNINALIPTMTMVLTYSTYAIIMKKELTASRVFSSMAIFEMVQQHFVDVFFVIPPVIQAKVSLDRINDFLTKTELLDKYTTKGEEVIPVPVSPSSSIQESDIIGIRASSFTWIPENDGTVTPGSNRRNFTLRIEEEVAFKKGCINLIIGQTGSGKTSLLMALLGEMHHIPIGPDSIVSLPRHGGVAYHAQESWVLNETIRNNILFGSDYDEKRYNAVIDQCGLKRDLGLFEAGDRTEVGEKGLTLSGGQKARITLARAVYSSAEILLLDDVLAALDVHTARWVVEKCFRGDLIKGRTVLLVTHNVALASPIADYVIAMGSDGRILSQGSLSNALAKDVKLSEEAADDSRAIEQADEVIDESTKGNPATKSDGKLVMSEEVSEGHVGWSALKLLFANMRGPGGLTLFWVSYVSLLLLSRLASTLQTWVLALWAGQYEPPHTGDVTVVYYLALYVGVVIAYFTAYSAGFTIYVFGALRASRRIHQLLVDSVFGTTLRWLDTTPSSRVIARCTQDIQSLDGPVVNALIRLLDHTLNMLMKFLAVIALSPIFSVPGVILAGFGIYVGNMYMKAQLPVKREMSNAKAPVLGHFGAAIAGLVSIRAYGAQEAFRKESFSRIDNYSRTSMIYWDLNRWISIRTDALAGLFASGLGTYLVYGGGGASSSQTGFSLTMAVGFSSMFLFWVRIFNFFETNGNSLERIQQYTEIEQEEKPSESGIPPAYWPASGELRVENLSARYSAGGPEVLHNLSFSVKSGERVGIVGRTGSGKSSLTLSLLRCIITEGKVYFDGIPTDKVNLDILRSNITIIPQVPELLSGTLRQNLDPFSQHDDAILNDALRASGLFSLQREDDEDRITLDTPISGGGSNLSVGQRQILALARAIVRQSKLLILDEATSAIDYETDTVIQTSLRNQLKNDVTLITVAHRLQTIMDADKIMVLDGGRIVEFDRPGELLKNETGMLRALEDESGDKENLYAMAKRAAISQAE